MKYNLVEMIKQALKSNLQEEEIVAIEDIVNSTYPEFDGLRVIRCEVIIEDKDYIRNLFGDYSFDSKTLFLTNMYYEDFLLRFKRNEYDNKPTIYQVEILGKSIYIRYEINKENKDNNSFSISIKDLVYTTDDDIIACIHDNEKSKYNFSIYTNAGHVNDLIKDKCVPVSLIPDYETKFSCEGKGISVDDDSLFGHTYVYLKVKEYMTKSMTIRNFCNIIQKQYYNVYPHINKRYALKKDK